MFFKALNLDFNVRENWNDSQRFGEESMDKMQIKEWSENSKDGRSIHVDSDQKGQNMKRVREAIL